MKQEEFYEEIVPAKCIADTPDWEKFRREAAKDILVALCNTMPINMKEDVRQAINIADELIKQLKEEQK